MDPEKKKVDPGWNDPPMLNYSASNPPPKSRITNKRVAFPLNQNQNVSSKNVMSPGGIPPVTVENTTGRFDYSLEELFQRSTENFNQLLINVNDDDIKSKINLISVLWKENKFPVHVQEYIYELSLNLIEKNIGRVNEIQLKIAMEGGSVCNAWLPAVKYLTNNM